MVGDAALMGRAVASSSQVIGSIPQCLNNKLTRGKQGAGVELRGGVLAQHEQRLRLKRL